MNRVLELQKLSHNSDEKDGKFKTITTTVLLTTATFILSTFSSFC